jgi:hypothetical protein
VDIGTTGEKSLSPLTYKLVHTPSYGMR